jgi:hypothetical protein
MPYHRLNWPTGSPIGVSFEDGERVTGWLYGELNQDLLIALDRAGKDIRFFTKPWSSAGRRDAPYGTFAPENFEELTRELRELDENVREEFHQSINHLDFRLLQILINRASDLRDKLHQVYYTIQRDFDIQLSEDDPQNDLLSLELAKVTETVDLHDQLFEELTSTGIVELCNKYSEILGKFPARYIIPNADFVGIDERMLPEETPPLDERIWNEAEHRRRLSEAQRVRDNAVLRMLSRRPRRPAGERRRSREEEPAAEFNTARYIGASLRIIAGTGLTVGNAALAVTAGLTSTIMTIGATAVPNYVGVLGSICTGLVQAADGLEKISSASPKRP